MSEFRVNGDMFGMYCMIPTGCSGTPHIYKVISRMQSNAWCEPPLIWSSEKKIHNQVRDVLNVIHCGICGDKVICVALDDCKLLDKDSHEIARRVVYSAAIAVYGAEPQMVVACEEMSELTKELCKWYRGKENIEAIAEEIADVTIMLEQLKLIFNISPKVETYMDSKLDRLAERIAKKYGEAEHEM